MAQENPADARRTQCNIYARVIDHCEPYEQDGFWARIKSPEAFRMAVDDAELLAALGAEFSEDELRASRVTAAGPDGSRSLHPGLTQGSALIALRASAQEAPYELLTNQGPMAYVYPVASIRSDGITKQSTTKFDTVLCAAFSLNDAIALRSAGVPAALATHLDEINGSQVRKIGRHFDWRKRSRTAWEAPTSAPFSGTSAVEDGPWQMMLVGWSPSALSLESPAGFQATCSHLGKVAEHLRFSLDEVYIWRPKDEELLSLEFCLRHGERCDVSDLLRESIDRSTRPLVDAGGLRQAAPPGYPEALAAYWRLSRRGSDHMQCNAAWSSVEELLDRDVIQPLVQQAMASPDPLRRNLQIAAAEFASRLHTKLISGKGSGDGEFDLKHLSALADQMTKLSRAASDTD